MKPDRHIKISPSDLFVVHIITCIKTAYQHSGGGYIHQMMVVPAILKIRFSSQEIPPFPENKKDLITIPIRYHNQVFKNLILFSDALNISVLLIFFVILVRLNEVSFFFAYGLVEFIYINFQTHRIIGLYADVDQLNYRLNMCRNYYVNTIFQPRHSYRNTILRHYVQPQRFYALA